MGMFYVIHTVPYDEVLDICILVHKLAMLSNIGNFRIDVRTYVPIFGADHARKKREEGVLLVSAPTRQLKAKPCGGG